jgi:hypothetical protein
MDEKRTTVWWPALLAIATGIYAIIEFSPPLTSERPQLSSMPRVSLVGDQNFPARLWEDPIEATGRSDIRELELTDLIKQMTLWVNDKYQVKVLGVFVEGFAYPEDREVRLRLRYAVQMAFNSAGFKPANRNHLGSVSVPWPKGSEIKEAGYALEPTRELQPPECENSQSGPDPKSACLDIPFEWFVSETGDSPVAEDAKATKGKRAVLVLWLKEEEFADFPLVRLLRLQKAFQGSLDEKYGTDLDLTIIGPRSSDTLQRIRIDSQREPLKALRQAGSNSLNTIPFYSAEATTPDVLLLDDNLTAAQEVMKPVGRGLFMQASFPDACINPIEGQDRMGPHMFIHNFTRTDAELAAMLADELRLRNVDLSGKEKGKVAVVFEGDTLYGRSLYEVFKSLSSLSIDPGKSFRDSLTNKAIRDAHKGHLQKSKQHSAKTQGISHRSGILGVVYLRGLDGTSARRHEQGTELKKNRESGKSSGSTDGQLPSGAKGSNSERAESDYQLDYARRLAVKLEGRCGGQPEAIGIFGSDIYDKLLLLQALRKQFPDTLFFTTDLDARYLQPSVVPYTRNLIVATTYPLDPTLVTTGDGAGLRNWRITPFRDSTQTAVFLACRTALGKSIAILPEPKIYEVGRSEFIRLPLYQDDKATLNRKCFSYGQWGSLTCIAIIGIILTLRLLPMGLSRMPGIRRYSERFGWYESTGYLAILRQERNRRIFGVTLLGVILIVSFTGFVLHRSGAVDSEPFRWLQGVSIWPTEIVRLVSLLLVIVFLTVAWYKHRIHRMILWFKFLKAWGDAEINECGAGGELAVLDEKYQSKGRKLRSLYRSVCRKLRAEKEPDKMSTSSPAKSDSAPSEQVYPEEILTEYFSMGLWWNRTGRVVLMLILYTLFIICFLKILPFPLSTNPARGSLARFLDYSILYCCILSSCFLTFYVFDVTNLTLRMIRRLGQHRTAWPQDYLNQLAKERNMDPAHLAGYADVYFTAVHTREVSSVVFYPFVVLLLMVVARNQYFEDWPWPLPLIIILFLNALFILLCSFWIRHAARRVRHEALKDLTSQTVDLLVPEDSHKWMVWKKDGSNVEIKSDSYSKSIERTREEINSISIGAYGRWFLDNSVIASLIPSIGAALLALISYLFPFGAG